MTVRVTGEAFDPWRALADHVLPVPAAQCGATAVFVGHMRDVNEGDAVARMELEHYPGMTERHLEAICAEAASRWALIDTLVVHRVGVLEPADPIVLVAVWSAHRAEAFEACRYIMEDLKSRAPFWKKETLPEGSRWVEMNTPGHT
jgi:molybdopterin synthase catalytic subunit